jgi:hypothetical protein
MRLLKFLTLAAFVTFSQANEDIDPYSYDDYQQDLAKSSYTPYEDEDNDFLPESLRSYKYD